MTLRASGSRFHVANESRGTVLAASSRRVTDPVSRGIGLIGRKELKPGEGLIIKPCNSVVSFFMRFPIDVVFINSEGNVCYLLPNMVPWRVSKMVRGSKFVVELPTGTIAGSSTEVGDKIAVSPT